MEIHIVEHLTKKNYYFAFIGRLEKSFKFVNNKVFSDDLTKPEEKAILNYFNSLKYENIRLLRVQ